MTKDKVTKDEADRIIDQWQKDYGAYFDGGEWDAIQAAKQETPSFHGVLSQPLKIDPERLRILRGRKRLSRSQLARKSHVSQRQIQRIEDPSVSNGSVREQTLARLASALNVEREVLTGAAPMPKDSMPKRDTERVQTGVAVSLEVHLAYSLVKRRYGVTATDIINMAPLFFVLLAEGSLAWRREKLAELEEAADRMTQIGTNTPHLGYANCAYRIEESTPAERQSIEKPDLFGRDLSEDLYNFGGDSFQTNPFANYLTELADDLDNVDVDASVGEDFPGYKVCGGDLRAITGDSWVAKTALESGYVRLADVPQELMADDATAARRMWLEDKAPREVRESWERRARLKLKGIDEEQPAEEAVEIEDRGGTARPQDDASNDSGEGGV